MMRLDHCSTEDVKILLLSFFFAFMDSFLYVCKTLFFTVSWSNKNNYDISYGCSSQLSSQSLQSFRSPARTLLSVLAETLK